jgi:hypothetical protein
VDDYETVLEGADHFWPVGDEGFRDEQSQIGVGLRRSDFAFWDEQTQFEGWVLLVFWLKARMDARFCWVGLLRGKELAVLDRAYARLDPLKAGPAGREPAPLNLSAYCASEAYLPLYAA